MAKKINLTLPLMLGQQFAIVVLGVGLIFFWGQDYLPQAINLTGLFMSLVYGVALGLAIQISYLIVIKLIPAVNSLFKEDLSKLRELLPIKHLGHILLISFLAGLGEELLFRVFVQNLAVEYWGIAAGVIFASFLFALMHAVSLAYVIYTFLLGATLGGVYIWTQDMILIIAAHTVYDICAFVLIYYFPQYLGLDVEN